MRGDVGDTERMRSLWVAALLGSALAGGCTTYRDQLARGERAYEKSDYDRSIALLRDIEHDFAHLSPSEQADYAFVRGMSDYNIGYKLEARHWLAVARACDERTPGSLSADQKAKTASTLDELNKPIFAEGTQALSDQRKDAPPPPAPSAEPAAKPKPKANPEVPDDDP